MTMMCEERQDYLKSLNEFLSQSKSFLANVVEELGWSKESIYSDLHKRREELAASSVSSHGANDEQLGAISKASTVHEGDDRKMSSSSLDSKPLYAELVAELTLGQDNSKKNENKSRTEELAEMLKLERDAKRRRISYKNRVHTKNKSIKEILREVIAEQMTTLPGFTEVQISPSTSSQNEIQPDKADLIEVPFPGGNPHLAWKTIIEQQESKKKETEKSEYRKHSSLKDPNEEKDRSRKHYNDKTYYKNDYSYNREKRDYHYSKKHEDHSKYESRKEDYSKKYPKDKHYKKYDHREHPSDRRRYEDGMEVGDKKDHAISYEDSNKYDSDEDTDKSHRKKEKKHKKKKRKRSTSSSPRRHKSKKSKRSHS